MNTLCDNMVIDDVKMHHSNCTNIIKNDLCLHVEHLRHNIGGDGYSLLLEESDDISI